MKLGFITGSLAWCSSDGGVWTNAGLGRLIDAIDDRVGELNVAMSHVAERGDQHDHRLGTRNVRFFPSMPSLARGVFDGARCHRVLSSIERHSDVLVVQLPFSAPTALAAPATPRVYHVCADLPEVVRASKFYRGVRRATALGVAYGIDVIQHALVASPHARCVTNGEELLRNFGRSRGRAVVSSTLRASDIASVRRARPLGAPFRILFVGFLRPEKGGDVLVDAFTRFRSEVDSSAELEIVGGQDLVESGAATELAERLKELEAAGAARRAGQIPFGPELFAKYADADVLVLPSRSEGTPRVLVEARAFGCPVIASRVGGIPTSVSDDVDGLLVPPDDPRALCDALRRVRNDATLRQRLIERGLARVREMTVDAQADAIVAEAVSAASGTTRRSA